MTGDFGVANLTPAHIFRAVGKEVRRAAKVVARRLEISGYIYCTGHPDHALDLVREVRLLREQLL